jgi:hypothetical protein
MREITMEQMEQIVILARRFIELGVRPDDDDNYDEFEKVVHKLDDLLNIAEGKEY